MEEYLREKKREYSEERKAPYSLEDLRNIMRILRSEEGCPWDRRQTFESMVSCVTEEAKEVIQAVKQQDMTISARSWEICCFRWYFTARWRRSRASLLLSRWWTGSVPKWSADIRRFLEEECRKQTKKKAASGSR